MSGRDNTNQINDTNRKNRIVAIAGIVFLAVFAAVTVMSPELTLAAEAGEYTPTSYSTFMALIPPLVAIVLSLLLKEAYSALFLGIVTGALIYSQGNLELGFTTMLFNPDGGLIANLADSSHASILLFVAMLGMIVMLMNRAGGSEAFGRWAGEHIKTKKGALLSTMLLGILIFVDDGFNCMTVGTVMRPVTDRFKISRAKLAYIIDSTAAPICIIAPISSWAAAVSYSMPEDVQVNGFNVFLRTIPYNLYALGTLAMMLGIILWNVDFSAMAALEAAAERGELREGSGEYLSGDIKERAPGEGKIIDLVVPVLMLIVCSIVAMTYTGGFFRGVPLAESFANADGAMSLVMGSSITLIFTFFFYISRGVMTFQEYMECIPGGWKSFIAPMIVLIMAWTLSGMTGLLGAREFIRGIMAASAGGFRVFLPCIIFLVAVFLAFSTGTSWGTFSILIPIVCNVFAPGEEMFVISIAACLSGAVCGDHCSPLSDTTIMASAGGRVDHLDHVSSQIPYAVFVAAFSALGYLIAGIIGYNTNSVLALVSMPITMGLILIALYMIRFKVKRP